MRKVKGFTLIELLVVLSIVMMLMLLVIPNVTSKLNSIKEKGCEALIRMINSQIQLYEIKYTDNIEISDGLTPLILIA